MLNTRSELLFIANLQGPVNYIYGLGDYSLCSVVSETTHSNLSVELLVQCN